MASTMSSKGVIIPAREVSLETIIIGFRARRTMAGILNVGIMIVGIEMLGLGFRGWGLVEGGIGWDGVNALVWRAGLCASILLLL